MAPLLPSHLLFFVIILLIPPLHLALNCREINSFTVCEIPLDIQPPPPDPALPIDFNFSNPSSLTFRQTATSTFTATIIGSRPSSYTTAINQCMILASANWRSSVPVSVHVNFSALSEPLILGQGQPTRNWIVNDYICPVVLAEAIVGEELNKGYPGLSHYDILMTLNTATNWYAGLDARAPSGQYDLVTVCLHEIYHGLFMSGGNIGISLSPIDLTYSAIFVRENIVGRFDSFMANQDGCNITAYKDDPISLGTALTGNNLWFVSESVRIARLYAPRPYLAGSSLYHLSEADYGPGAGGNNDLMTPAIGSNYAQHSVGEILTRIQELVLDIEKKSGADKCEVVNPPEVDNTPIEQGTGGENGDRGNESNSGFVITIGDKTVNGWILVGGLVGGIIVLVVVGTIIRCMAVGSKRGRNAGAQKRYVKEARNIANGGNGGGIV